MPKRKQTIALRNIRGQNMWVYRAAAGLSQEALAERCGIKRTYIDAIERGEVDPHLGTVQKIAAGLNMQAFRLLISADEQLSSRLDALL